MTNGSQKASSLRESMMGSLAWRCIGPHRGGRVVAVAGDVADPMTFYFGACAGGVWKTTDGGTYWHNVSDGFFTTAAVGAIAVSASDPNVLYVGTGETCVRGNVSHGDGVYKSTDAGRTWTNVGLPDTRHIGTVVIHPRNPDLVYVAALGHAFGPNEERGVFRSRDSGTNWEKVLHTSPQAGSHDLAMDPNNPRILYAAIWQVQRYPHALVNGGEECGLWRSFDGGDSWEEITRKPGLPTGLLGKIGVAASPAKPGRVWALVEAEDGAVFRSDDYGDTWVRCSEQSLLRTRPWYYMHITADPRNADTVWVQNYSLWKSIDGGATFDRAPTPHGDDHALWIDPNDTRRMIEGNDGGACVTFNGGASWSSIYNQPTAQLYHVTTDDQMPYRVYGSQQDNTAISIPSRSLDGAIHERDWYAPGGGESGYIAIKPDEPWHVVASGPVGRRAYNDIMTHYDHRTGQKRNITVWPELYGWGVGAETLKYRFQWTFPIHFSRHDPRVLYVCSNHVHRSTDLGGSWEVISPDLTRNDPTKLAPSGGPITRDNTGAEVYCTIFAFAESPHQPGLIWAGTDDGLVHLSDDGGQTWRDVTPPDLPAWSLISIIEPSPHDPATAYLAATRYKLDDTRPYLYRTNDEGRTWTRISDGIPEDDFTRVIREDPNRRGLLYAGTETGIYASFDDGASWQRLGGNLPVVPMYDFVIKGVELVVATHGRSFWILDDLTPLHQLKDGIGDEPAYLFQPRSTVRMRVSGGRIWRDPVPATVNYARADTSLVSILPVKQPDGSIVQRYLDAGENPPEGVVIQYALSEEPADGVSLAVLDATGNELRTFEGEEDKPPARHGVNRFVWNLRLPGTPRVEADDLEPWHRPDGPMVLPGNYQIRLTVDGKSLTRPLAIEPDPRLETTMEELQAQHDLLREILAALTTTNETLNRIDALLAQLATWDRRTAGPAQGGPVREAVIALGDELRAIRGELIDVNMRQSQLWPSGLHEKLNALFDSVDSADYAPPQQARAVFGELKSRLDGLMVRFDQVSTTRVQSFNDVAQAAGLGPVGLPA
ncbi:MAG: VPS10 domain-containing protein [Thermomicrobiales bacterium]